MLGRTVAGYLLVSVFFAYDVLLYVVTTNLFGWWSPAEALVHPDVLATYAPWLSAISNSFQAGFWEEALFRAVPIAGAALIGDRFGKRRPVHRPGVHHPGGHLRRRPRAISEPAVVCPAGGADSAVDRLRAALSSTSACCPGIILHFAFDVVWFALPIFLAKAPGIWFQQLMVIVLTLVPVWDRAVAPGAGGPMDGAGAGRLNAAWTPRRAPAPVNEAPVIASRSLSARTRTAWLAIGAVARRAARGAGLRPAHPYGTLPITSSEAASRSRAQALQRAASTLGRSGE